MTALSCLKEEVERLGLELSEKDIKAILAIVNQTSQGLRQLRQRNSMQIEPVLYYYPSYVQVVMWNEILS